MKAVITLSICMLLLVACSGAQSDADAVATIVAGTIAASNQQAAATSTPAQPATGTIEGNICFPSEGIPPMNLYIQALGTTDPLVYSIAQNQTSFTAQVDPGTYTAYAWLPDFSYGGSYSQAVACGLSAECSDHSLVQFQVIAGAATGGVSVCDWYGNPGDIPLPAGAVAPQAVGGEVAPVASGGQATGSISGSLSYPSEMIPAMVVVAWDLSNEGVYYYTNTAAGTSYYQIPNLPIGLYHVVAYVDSLAGGYTYAVQCGLDVSCTDHGLVYVEVFAGVDSYGADPQDWYAPEDAFRSNPFNP